jgi:DNA-binding MarR family transcriptional regulator
MGNTAHATIIDALHRTTQIVNQRYANAVGDDGPTPRQLAVLAEVERNEGLSQTHISNATGVDRATTAEIVGRLTRLGLIRRRRTRTDTRVYAVSITEHGREVLLKAQSAAESTEKEVLAILSSEDRAHLLRILSRLAEAHHA